MRKGTLKGVLLGFLLALLAAGLWMRSRQGPVKTIDPLAASGNKTWRTVFHKVYFPATFQIPKWQAWTVATADPWPDGIRYQLRGRYAASTPYLYATVISQEDFEKVQAGYPPLRIIASLKPNVDFIVALEQGSNVVMFYQSPPQPELAEARSAAALLALALKTLQAENPAPASVSSKIELVMEAYTTPAEFEKILQLSAPKPKPPAQPNQIFGGEIGPSAPQQ